MVLVICLRGRCFADYADMSSHMKFMEELMGESFQAYLCSPLVMANVISDIIRLAARSSEWGSSFAVPESVFERVTRVVEKLRASKNSNDIAALLAGSISIRERLALALADSMFERIANPEVQPQERYQVCRFYVKSHLHSMYPSGCTHLLCGYPVRCNVHSHICCGMESADSVKSTVILMLALQTAIT